MSASEPLSSWRYAWRLFTFRPRYHLINLALVLVGWSAAVLVGLAARHVFDRLATTRPGSSLGWLVWPLTLLAMDAVSCLIVPLTLQATNGRFAYGNATRLQRNALRRILELPGGRALPGSTGEAVSRFRDDTEEVIWWPIQMSNVIGSIVAGSLALLIMWSVSPVMTAAVVLPLAAVIAVVEAARGRLVAYRLANRESTASVTGFLGDVCAAAPGIQIAHAQVRVVAHFRMLNARRRRAAVRDRLLEECLKGSFWVISFGTAAVLLAAGPALREGRFSVGDLALFVAYLAVYENFVRDIGEALTGYRQLGVSYRRLHELLADAPAQDLVDDDEIYQHRREGLPSGAPPPLVVEPFRGLRALGLRYRHPGGSGGIHGVDIDIAPGSFTVVTGRVGAGKTTLLQSLLGLLPADGELRWNDSVVGDPAAFVVPPRVAYTPQVPQLFSETLADNVRLGLPVGPEHLAAAFDLAVLDEDVAVLPHGAETAIGSRGVRLSGGQLQRTAAARMFVRRPQVLVCDDLSSALDVRTEAALWERVLAGGDRTVLAVSHRRAALARADTVVVLRDGRVDATGALTDLLPRCAELRALWRAGENELTGEKRRLPTLIRGRPLQS